MSTLHIHWDPDPIVFGEAIMEVEGALRDTTIPLTLAREQVQADIRERFITETDPSGKKWKPWAESYEDYALEYPNVGILRQNEALYNAATSEGAFVISGDALFFEADLPSYGEGHQEGIPDRTTKAGVPNPLPARPFLGLSNETRTMIFATFGEWFDRVIDLYPTALGRIGARHSLRGGAGRFIPRSSRVRVG